MLVSSEERVPLGRWLWKSVLVAMVVSAVEGCDVKRRVSPPPSIPQQRQPVQVPTMDTPEQRAQGIYHVVKRGETLWRICKAYGADLQYVAEINNIRDPSQIREGQRIFIPGAPKSKTPAQARIASLPSGEPEPQIQTFQGKFVWPVRGEITSPFGVRNGMKHSGIDIKAPSGTPVVAAASGEVVYCGELRGYGNVMIIRHSDELSTVYAHLKDILVQEHQRVTQGQVIATVGNTGRSEGAHLHFEVRVKNVARNPLFYLPDSSQ